MNSIKNMFGSMVPTNLSIVKDKFDNITKNIDILMQLHVDSGNVRSEVVKQMVFDKMTSIISQLKTSLISLYNDDCCVLDNKSITSQVKELKLKNLQDECMKFAKEHFNECNDILEIEHPGVWPNINNFKSDVAIAKEQYLARENYKSLADDDNDEQKNDEETNELKPTENNKHQKKTPTEDKETTKVAAVMKKPRSKKHKKEAVSLPPASSADKTEIKESKDDNSSTK